MDESPSISPNGNVIVYSIKENGWDALGVTLSEAKFRFLLQRALLESQPGQVF